MENIFNTLFDINRYHNKMAPLRFDNFIIKIIFPTKLMQLF